MIPTIFDCCRPREDVLSDTLGDYAAELRTVLTEKGPDEYTDPAQFFANSYPTDGLRRLLAAVGRRLSHAGSAEGSTIRLDSTFGGGKTHGMIALVHLARYPATVPAEFLDPSFRPRTPSTVAAFDGEMANVVAGVDLEGGLRAKTPWGYLAYKLAGLSGFDRIRQNDEQCSAPGVEDWDQIIGDRPALILIDEIGEWLRKLRNKEDWKQLAPFLKALIAAVDARPDACLVISLAVGRGGRATDAFVEENEYAARAFGEAESVTARKVIVLNPTADDETASVLTRRLFAQVDASKAAAAVDGYASIWEAQKAHLPAGKFGIQRREALARSYPFHPDLVETLNAKTATFQNFQRVRGMLRILAPTIRQLWKTKPGDATAVHVHHIDLGAQGVRTEFTTRLGQQAFDSAITYDIANSDPLRPARAQRLDAQFYRDTAPFASYVARAIFVNSMAFNTELRGVAVEDLRAAMLAPGFPGGVADGGAAFIEDARKRFVEESGYLDDRTTTLLRFAAEANLTRLIEQTKTNVDRTRVRDALKTEIATLFKRGSATVLGFDYIPYPGGPGDVPDDANDGKPYLAVMGYEAESIHDDVNSAPSLVARIAKFKGSEGTLLRINRNNVVFLLADRRKIADMEDAVARRLALEDLDARGTGSLAEHQVQRLRQLKQGAVQGAAVAIQQCYRHVFYPSGQALDDAGLAHLALEMDNAAADPGSGQKAVLRTLRDHQKVSAADDLPPNPIPVRDRTLLGKNGYMSTSDLRDEFRRERSQPILLGDEPFRKLIRAGIERDVFVYGKGDIVFALGTPPLTIEVSENAYVYTKRDAQDKGVWPKRKPEPEEPPQFPPDRQKATPDSTPRRIEDGASSGAADLSTGGIVVEGPLREVFAQLRDAAQAAPFVTICITAAEVSDAAALVLYAPNVREASASVAAEISYQTDDGSYCDVRFRGTPAEARHVIDFAKPQLAASADSVAKVTLLLAFVEPLRADALQRLGEQLGAVSPGIVRIEAQR